MSSRITPQHILDFWYSKGMQDRSRGTRRVDQDLSVRLFEAAKLESNLRFAQHHRELIRKYGRFPHRTSLLGRQSTPEEIEYLASGEAFLG